MKKQTGVVIVPRIGEGDWRSGGKLISRAKMQKLLDSHFRAVGPKLRALEDWRMRSRIAARTDVACSGGECGCGH